MLKLSLKLNDVVLTKSNAQKQCGPNDMANNVDPDQTTCIGESVSGADG